MLPHRRTLGGIRPRPTAKLTRPRCRPSGRSEGVSGRCDGRIGMCRVPERACFAGYLHCSQRRLGGRLAAGWGTRPGIEEHPGGQRTSPGCTSPGSSSRQTVGHAGQTPDRSITMPTPPEPSGRQSTGRSSGSPELMARTAEHHLRRRAVLVTRLQCRESGFARWQSWGAGYQIE